jgi:hypothetical protein
MKRYLVFLLVFFCSLALSAQIGIHRDLSPSASMSILTASPGLELYSVFGHSALRVYDPVNGIDEVYNYGTFDFETPNFYGKFASGQLLYRLTVSSIDRFLLEYYYEGRAVYEQILNLTADEMQRIYDFLQVNRQPENRDYLYDFFFDNCSTRLRDLLQIAVEPDWGEEVYMGEVRSFRHMLKPYLEQQPWSRFGIDLVLGLPADRIASPWNYMFLPDELFLALAQARLPDGRPLVDQTLVILEKEVIIPEGNNSPIWIAWIIFALGIIVFFSRKAAIVFNRAYFIILGLIGLVIFYLWFISDHHAANNNINILWALPTHLYFIFKVKSQAVSGISRLYWRITGILNLILIVFWFWLPQDLHPAFFPLILLAAVNSLNFGFFRFRIA